LGLRERGNSGGSGVDVDVQRVNGDGGGVGKRGKKEGDGGTGIVIMDNVGEGGDWELVRLIIGLNMGVLAKMDEATQYLN
jgi:1-phosphatidylinositol phosphodiesterase